MNGGHGANRDISGNALAGVESDRTGSGRIFGCGVKGHRISDIQMRPLLFANLLGIVGATLGFVGIGVLRKPGPRRYGHKISSWREMTELVVTAVIGHGAADLLRVLTTYVIAAQKERDAGVANRFAVL